MRIKLKDFVRTGKTDTIKASTHGLFLKKEYICISILKIGETSKIDEYLKNIV